MRVFIGRLNILTVDQLNYKENHEELRCLCLMLQFLSVNIIIFVEKNY